MSEHYDVIIIGTGAGGGTLAHKLAPSGKRILVVPELVVEVAPFAEDLPTEPRRSGPFPYPGVSR
jgi:2-polyprenyl-6-methoxyphenol hydroxylase-like FAD-dependent oxidoreductase